MLQVENGINVIPEHRAKVSQAVFKFMNTYYMVPFSKLGLLPLLQNPLTGYIMILQTIGRKSGKVRCTPLNYALADGYIYCIAGFGLGTDWLANLKANPVVEVRVAGTKVRGHAEIVTEGAEADRVFIQVIHNCGLAALLVGLSPFTLTDENILRKRGPEVVVRIRPDKIVGGSLDPGGKGWFITALMQIAFVLWLSRLLFARKRRLRRRSKRLRASWEASKRYPQRPGSSTFRVGIMHYVQELPAADDTSNTSRTLKS